VFDKKFVFCVYACERYSVCWCNMLHCVAMCCIALTTGSSRMCKRETVCVCAKTHVRGTVCCSVFLCVAVCCRECMSVCAKVLVRGSLCRLRCFERDCNTLQHNATQSSILQHTATYCNTHDFSQRYTVWVEVSNGAAKPCNTHDVERRLTVWFSHSVG